MHPSEIKAKWIKKVRRARLLMLIYRYMYNVPTQSLYHRSVGRPQAATTIFGRDKITSLPPSFLPLLPNFFAQTKMHGSYFACIHFFLISVGLMLLPPPHPPSLPLSLGLIFFCSSPFWRFRGWSQECIFVPSLWIFEYLFDFYAILVRDLTSEV